MRFSHKKQSPLLAFFVVLEFFAMNAFPVLALFGGPSIPSASSIMSDMEQRYHLDPAALQNQGELMNVSGSKGYAPEVSLSFSPSDPKPGEKLSAKAFPIYFSNEERALYYTWYLKHTGCDLKKNVIDIDILDKCNASDPNRGIEGERKTKDDIDVEDWKIEAARIIAQGGYDNVAADYSKDTDDDGYQARYGGDNKTNVPNRCYANDASTGINYEFVKNLPSSADSGCSSGTPVCVAEEQGMDPGTTVDGSGSTFTSGGNGKFSISGYPACSSSSLVCNTGTPKCTSTLTNITTSSLMSPDLTCTVISRLAANPYCFHLFPNSNTNVSGNGSFSANEEDFWDTDPKDPSTADNGNKDESNVVGLGQSTFTWTYDKGDQVGVAVEGTSMFATKFGDSSFMIMWAFPKKNCPVLDLADQGGYYVDDIKGYQVKIDAVKGFDLNKCIAYIKKDKNGNDEEKDMNLVDPTEGGQATKLSVSVTASPENPLNDTSEDKGGDTVIVQATVDNAAQSIANISFDWKVSIGNSIASFSNGGGAVDITDTLRALKLLGNTKGNALDSISLKLDIKDTDISPHLSTYLSSDGIGYLQFKVATEESFAEGGKRTGTKDDSVIVKFVSSGDKISVYKVNATVPPVGTNETTKVSLSNDKICESPSSSNPVDIEAARLDRTLCRVIKNQIIGLKVDDPDNKFSNFNWAINGSPLLCTERVSGACTGTSQNGINFFPVSGNPGDTYTVTVTANDVASGKTATLTRSFNVVEPKVFLKSTTADAWQKFLGQYKDISSSTACPNGLCDDLSESIYQTYSGSEPTFEEIFIPTYLKDSVTTKEWSLDNEAVVPNATTGEVKFPAEKPAGGVYNVNFLAQLVPSDDIRKALADIWGITGFDSPEINFGSTIQVEVEEVLTTEGPLAGPRKYYAAIASYIPASILFTFRIFLSVALTLFALSFLNALLEERRIKAFIENFSKKR